MPATVVVGAQWGDEGKGKIVDLLTPHANWVVRYAGGANAGHTLVVAGEKIVLHLIPSGILHPQTQCLVGQGCVVDLDTLLHEIETLESRGVHVAGRLFLADRAHIVLPYHKEIDALRESTASKLGTTKRGIGPAYEDKTARVGIRVGDLFLPDLGERVGRCLDRWAPTFASFGASRPRPDAITEQLLSIRERIRPLVCDGSASVHNALQGGQRVLLEGAQGTLLDIDHGTYPYVTSSTATSGGACTGAGVGPIDITHVLGITKAYATRVGDGPFPTELMDAVGDDLRTRGAEFGATTGRPRRCGWLDLPALRYAVRVNGLTALAITKLDVLTGMSSIELCTGYRIHGAEVREVPFAGLEDAEPIYESHPGWTEDVSKISSREALPEAARSYLARIEEQVGCPIDIISVGPDRQQTIGAADPFRERR